MGKLVGAVRETNKVRATKQTVKKRVTGEVLKRRRGIQEGLEYLG